MPVLRMSLHAWARYHEYLPEQAQRAARLGARSAALRVVALMVRRTREAKPASPNGLQGAVNTGDLLRGWQHTPLPDGSRVFNDRPHAPIVESGRRPGSRPPPVIVIERWLIRRCRMSPKKAHAIAPAVAREIGRRGLVGRDILSAPDAQAQIERILETEVQHELDRVIAEGPGPR